MYIINTIIDDQSWLQISEYKADIWYVLLQKEKIKLSFKLTIQ